MAKATWTRTKVPGILLGTLCFFLSVRPVSVYGQASRLVVRPAAAFEEITFDYFGNQAIEIPVTIQGVLDAGTQVQARLIQRSAALETPILSKIPVPFEKTATSPDEATALIKLTLPEVQRETEFVLRIFAFRESQSEALIGEWRLCAYPKGPTKDFQQWSEQVQLRVSDDKGDLSAFLEEQEMSFQDYRSPAREARPVVTLAVHTGERSFRRDRFIKPGQTTIIFHEDSDPLGHILVNKDGGGRTIDVHMKLFDTLANNPRTQQMLLAIFQKTLD
ncbi:MAG: hypothetical protein K8I00_03340 [Candidatus Omnitrophica bacterium]|nr:hypothetical protein [Candidatus Omnitrophota bacterium]